MCVCAFVFVCVCAQSQKKKNVQQKSEILLPAGDSGTVDRSDG